MGMHSWLVSVATVTSLQVSTCVDLSNCYSSACCFAQTRRGTAGSWPCLPIPSHQNSCHAHISLCSHRCKSGVRTASCLKAIAPSWQSRRNKACAGCLTVRKAPVLARNYLVHTNSDGQGIHAACPGTGSMIGSKDTAPGLQQHPRRHRPGRPRVGTRSAKKAAASAWLTVPCVQPS